MKSFVTAAIVLATLAGGGVALPTGHVYRRGEVISPFWIPLSATYATGGNPGVISVGQSSQSNAAPTYPWSADAGYNFGGYGANAGEISTNAGQSASATSSTSAGPPAQNINVQPPSAGVNVGGQAAKPGQVSINTGKPAAVTTSTSVSSDGSVTATGENGGSGQGEDQGNGGTISVNRGAATPDSAGTTTPGSTGQPAQKVNGQGLNSGDSLANLGQLLASIGQPASATTTVNVPPGGSLNVSGENGGVGLGGNQGNGGTVTITKGAASGDATLSIASPLPVNNV